MYTKPSYGLKSKLHLGVSGSITQWLPEKAHGFIQTDTIEEPIFFHINVLDNKTQTPKIGEQVHIQAAYDEQKRRWRATFVSSEQRKRATALKIQRENAFIRPDKPKLLYSSLLILCWLALISYYSWQLAASFILISSITFIIYAWDKYCAKKQYSRIPENTLHALSLLGGFSGALLARYTFRHKTQKHAFIILFWLSVFINIIGSIYLIFSGSLNNLFTM